MAFIIRQKWIWMIIGICSAIALIPSLLIWAISQMPEMVRPIPVWLLIFGYGIAAGYKDWLIDSKKRGKPKPPEQFDT
jgi:hypothetical protein